MNIKKLMIYLKLMLLLYLVDLLNIYGGFRKAQKLHVQLEHIYQ